MVWVCSDGLPVGGQGSMAPLVLDRYAVPQGQGGRGVAPLSGHATSKWGPGMQGANELCWCEFALSVLFVCWRFVGLRWKAAPSN